MAILWGNLGAKEVGLKGKVGVAKMET